MIDDNERSLLQEKLSSFAADMALLNANVITMNDEQPRAEAVAIKNGKIVGVGSNTEIRQMCSAQTECLDFGGKTVLPGFVESHNHVSAYSHIVLQIDCTLKSCKSIKDIVAAVKKRAESQPKGCLLYTSPSPRDS